MPRIKKTAVSNKINKKDTKVKVEKVTTSSSSGGKFNTVNNLKFNASRNLSKIDRRVWPFLALLGLVILLLAAGKFFIVAWVDKRPITRFEEYKVLEQRYGKDVKEQLIVEKLVFIEAGKRGIKVSNQELNNEIRKIEGEQGGKDNLNQALQAQGITQEEFKKLVSLQILRQRMFGNNVNVSDDEINKYLQENNQQLSGTEDASTSARIKESVKQQLLQQKINTEFSNWLKQNLQSSRVVRY